MQPQFIPPSFQKPQDYSFIPQTVDSIINAYLEAKKQKEARSLASNESMLKYGIDLTKTNPQELMQGRQMASQQGPDQAGINPNLASIRDLYRKQFSTEDLSRRSTEADIGLKEAQAEKARMPASQTVKPPPGYRWSEGGLSLERVPGGPVDENAAMAADKSEQARNSAKVHAYNVVETGDKAIKAISGWTTGLTGYVAGKIPATDRKSLEGYLNTLKGNLSFERLTQMRQESKTGGALGNVSDNELKLLSSTVSSLDPDQKPKVLKENIQKVIDLYNNTIKKLEGSSTKQEAQQSIALTGDKAKRLAELRAKMGK